MLASEVIQSLGLVPLPVEGGYFLETYRSKAMSRTGSAERSAGTCIYYLLDHKSISAWHKVASDEIWLFQGGVPARQLLLFENGSWEERIIGCSLADGQKPQSVIPAGTWQSTVLDLEAQGVPPSEMNAAADHVWGLFSTVVIPGFEFADFQGGSAEELAARWPQAADLILTRYILN